MGKRKCLVCHKLFEPTGDSQRVCMDCAAGLVKKPGSTSTNRAEPPKRVERFTFDRNYLGESYFQDPGNKVLRPELVDAHAEEVAKALVATRTMTSNQFRLFFNKLRAVEARLRAGKSFDEVSADISALNALVALQRKRGVVPEKFKQFINWNVELASQNRTSFERGFMNHIRSVYAYFVFHNRK